MMERSDKFRWCICKRCGTIPIYSTKLNSSICKNCNYNELAVIETPYSFKLLMQELEAMGLQMRLNVERIEFPTEQLISLDENDIDTNIIIEKPKKIDEEKPKKIDEEKPKKIDEDKPKKIDEEKPKKIDEDKTKKIDEEKPKKIDEDKPKKIDEDKTKECPPGKVYNPETKRCISESNPLVKKLGLMKGGDDGDDGNISDDEISENNSDTKIIEI
jgi:hypothetical protein